MNTRAPWISRNPLLTAFLVVLWLALVIYAFARSDPLAWVLAGIFLFAVAIPTAVGVIRAPRAPRQRANLTGPHHSGARPAPGNYPNGPLGWVSTTALLSGAS